MPSVSCHAPWISSTPSFNDGGGALVFFAYCNYFITLPPSPSKETTGQHDTNTDGKYSKTLQFPSTYQPTATLCCWTQRVPRSVRPSPTPKNWKRNRSGNWIWKEKINPESLMSFASNENELLILRLRGVCVCGQSTLLQQARSRSPNRKKLGSRPERHVRIKVQFYRMFSTEFLLMNILKQGIPGGVPEDSKRNSRRFLE